MWSPTGLVRGEGLGIATDFEIIQKKNGLFSASFGGLVFSVGTLILSSVLFFFSFLLILLAL